MADYFIDSHCHMFTIADIPLYKSIFQFIKNGDKLHKRILFPFAGLILPIINLTGKVEEQEKYLRFFEHEPNENVSQLSSEIHQCVDAEGSAYAGRTILLTPLIMDFDVNGEVNKLNAQVQRLVDAIAASNLDGSRIKILPFLGMDPRRSNALVKIDKYDSLKNRTSPAILSNGSFIGIKLYPPLGFNPVLYPDFFRGLNERQLPITVHCQKDSFRLTSDADKFTDPKNWDLILASVTELRINFAHFGGEDEVAKTVKFRERGANEPGPPTFYEDIEEDTFTYRIIRMLKKYPNTYSDVAAFDTKNTGAVASLIWLLHKDNCGDFNNMGEHKLEDKLLWGTDYPMVLEDKNTSYTTIFSAFNAVIRRTEGSWYSYPKDLKLNADNLMQKMTCDNPKIFLNI